MILAILGLALGVFLGFIIPVDLPSSYTSYMSIALLAALDSVFGGVRAELENKFDSHIFISGFFGNIIIATFLAYFGDRVGIPLYYAAIFTFGTRMFQNFAIIRRIILKKIEEKYNR
ncbi:small basic family protein [Alkalibacter sp. M17DMB]|nr:small basic family protein [Alkalibacter mobilis]MBF7097134.1 small basic family protein [Alkalibacter mobilis]